MLERWNLIVCSVTTGGYPLTAALQILSQLASQRVSLSQADLPVLVGGTSPSGLNPIVQEAVSVVIVLAAFACSFRLCWLIATHGD